MQSTIKHIIQEHAIKNLLSAQKRIAEEEDAKSIIRITKFLFTVAEKFKDVVIEGSSGSKE